MSEDDYATRMMLLFSGAGRSHGTYVAEDVVPGISKHEIKRTARTVREPVTATLWLKHLTGKRPLGVVPIREDNCCLWGLVDVDVYEGLDLAALAARLAALGVPAHVLRSKSRGAHIVLFFREPVPAPELLPRLRELAVAVGHGEAEVFPKQERVLTERGDLGSWVNMPYFGGVDETGCEVAVERCAVGADGRSLALGAFLDLAERSRLNRTELRALPLRHSASGFGTGPPCLEHLAAVGVHEHEGRNDALLAYATLAKKMYPDGWEARLEEWNRTIMHPPLGNDEVRAIIHGMRKKNYRYRCRVPPLCNHCNYGLCITRTHGVKGGSGDAVPLESLDVLLTEPKLYFVRMKTGGTVACPSRVLTSPREFQIAAMEQLDLMLPEYMRGAWVLAVQRIVENMTKIEAPRSSTLGGEFEEHFVAWVAGRYLGERREELAAGKAWLDAASGRVFFTMRGLQTELERAKFAPPTYGLSFRGWITQRLREMGGITKQLWVSGRNVECWHLPASRFEWPNGHELPVPPIEEGPL